MTIRSISRSTTLAIILASLLLAGAVAAGTAGVRPSTGGPTISSAPELVPRRHEQGSSATSSAFYRIRLGARDKLLVRFSPTTKQTIVACLLAPAVGDYSVNETGCLPYGPERRPLFRRTDRKAELAATIPYAGRYTLGLVEAHCFSLDTIDVPCTYANPPALLGYELTAFVSRYTSLTLKAPTRVLAGRPFRVSGVIRGVASGTVTLARPTNRRWLPIGKAQIGADGVFAASLRLEKREPTRLRARYAGDRDHQASQRVVRVAVR